MVGQLPVLTTGRWSVKEDREIKTLKVWCCVGKASSLDTAAFLYSWGGAHWEGRKCRAELWSCWDLTSTWPSWNRNRWVLELPSSTLGCNSQHLPVYICSASVWPYVFSLPPLYCLHRLSRITVPARAKACSKLPMQHSLSFWCKALALQRIRAPRALMAVTALHQGPLSTFCL